MGTPGAFQFVTIEFGGCAPALGGTQNDHRPARTRGVSGFARGLLNVSNGFDAMLDGSGHRLVHGVVVRAFHKTRSPAVTAEQALEFLVFNARGNRWIVDLVAVEMKNREHRPIANRVQKFVDVPGGGERTGFRFTVANHRSDDQLRIVECRATGVRENVAQFAAFVNGPRQLWSTVAADAAWKRELLEEFAHAFLVFAFFRVNFGVGAFQISGPENAGCAVAGAGKENHFDIELFDEAI